ncbi:transposase, IS605 OrfB family (plasmid) [Peptoclostridium acidaminophilum DSM 3953]|uniref:Transposase, IS605 OrfB family n=1 Tax=Peptoclostridium acidaminophilum DSM 3953 TaxID=1286171 RepID=W8TA57_PEPAC|nr:RNA-guided endonuclease TnpB family protein [Peptoclostridium acidaminophilum]AHM57780.1 transposase, IS605 OrfB family [Peptoclostridium acidaminophilum DSM 3953]
MIRCHKTNFYATKTDTDRLFACNRLSAEIWNACLLSAKDYSLANDGKWIGTSQLQAEMKGRFLLHSQSVQAVCHKYLFARDSARAARLKGYKTKYPYKTKKNYNTKWVDKAFKVFPNGKVELSMGIFDGKRQKPITIWCKYVPNGDIKEIELVYDSGLMVSISYDDYAAEAKASGTSRVAVDLGEIHSIAAFCENGESLIVTGRKLRSIHRLRNKKLAELQRLMSRCKKGSRQWRRYNQAKQYILSKSEKQLKDALHKSSRKFADWCLANAVGEVAVGKVEGVQRNTKGKLRKKEAQKLSNWAFSRLQKYMEYKLKAFGVAMSKIDESYTTQTCPVCGKRKKTSGRTYKCKCSYSCHRDIHGARNILSKHINGGRITYVADIENTTYLRIA